MRARIRHLAIAAVGGAAALGAAAPPVAAYPEAPTTAAIDGTCEGELHRLHDAARESAGLPPLREDPAFDQVSRAWAFSLARTGRLAHNPSYVDQIVRTVPDWRRITENVGYASTASRLHEAYMNSSGHRANILDRSVQRVAIGCVRDGSGRLWSTVNFVGAASAIADRRPAPFRSAGDASSRLRWWLLADGPDAAQVESDAAKLLRSSTAADLAASLASSSTHATRVPPAVRLYRAAFGRHPDAAGLNYWVQQRQRGVSTRRMASIFASSAEFQRLYGPLGDRAFVEQVYRNVLRREPDAAGVDFWVERLRTGDTRADILLGFSESAENRRRSHPEVTVSWAFAQLVNREPSLTERTLWETRILAGQTPETLVRFLVSSTGFTTRAAGGTY